MARLFGTDGVRGLANKDITAELAIDLAVAAAHVLCEVGPFGAHRPTAVIGRDTRVSGQFLSAAVAAGLASAGVDVLDTGVLPTPAVANLVKSRSADMGVMLSASHNAMPDNGIKFFARGGRKLADELEDAIEARLTEEWDRPTGARVGRILSDNTAGYEYVAKVASTVSHSLDGLKVVCDCAHGAASLVGPAALRSAGAEVVVIGGSPDGFNINDGCGSTHLEPLQRAVVEHCADAGVAFDGDADRCLAVDAQGKVVDGDQIMGILALSWAQNGQLVNNTLVATVMSNLGLLKAMRQAGITVIQTKVGDRYVLEELLANGYNLGGEQSGHVVMPDYATTGDGVLTALHVLARMAETGKPLAQLAGVVQRLPQVMINVRGVDKARAATDPTVAAAVQAAETTLGDDGRVLLRPSGTEPVVRVMVEAATEADAQKTAESLADTVRTELAL